MQSFAGRIRPAEKQLRALRSHMRDTVEERQDASIAELIPQSPRARLLEQCLRYRTHSLARIELVAEVRTRVARERFQRCLCRRSKQSFHDVAPLTLLAEILWAAQR